MARQSGALVIADISGYTRFVSGVELEHGAAIVGDLLGVVVDELSGIASVANLEGDAAFCVTPSMPRPDSLLSALFGCYDAFRRRLRDARHLTTCTCAACSQMETLDLKLIVHAGEYLTHHVAGRREVAGPDVILVHRLLKNGVTGSRGYALITDTAVRSLALPVEAWQAEARTEHADDIGDVAVHVVDLDRLWSTEQARASVRVGRDDAHGSMEFAFPASPAVVWEWFSDPRKRPRWNLADRVDVDPADGPTGVGTVNHCVHGKSTITEEIVDWKPYRYCTLRVGSPLGPFLMTVDIEGDQAASNVAVRMRLERGGLKRSLFKLVFRAKISKDFTAGMDRLKLLLEQEPDPASVAGGGPAEETSAAR